MTGFALICAGLIALAVVLYESGIMTEAPPSPQAPGTPKLPDLEAKVQEIANATAFAEGYMDMDGNILTANVPARLHNPGDLGPGDAPDYNSTYEGGSQVVHFPDDETGWKFLKAKWRRILKGESHTYSLDETFTDVSMKYAGDWSNWVHNVTSYLSTSPNQTLRGWLNE